MTIIKISSKLSPQCCLIWPTTLSRYLNQLDVDLTGKTHFIPDSKIENGLFVLDTADLIGALLGETGNKKSLSKTCNLLQIPTVNLHNAGNDAHVSSFSLHVTFQPNLLLVYTSCTEKHGRGRSA